MSVSGKELFEFDAFRLDPAEHLLLRNGEPVALEPKVYKLLVVLVRHSGRLVTKEELMQAVWPDSFVEESSLTRIISILRKALSRTDGGPAYIETVPKQGYRFIGDVQTLADERAELIVRSASVRVVVEETESDEQTTQPADPVTRQDGAATIELEPATTPGRKPDSSPARKGQPLALFVALALLIVGLVVAVYYFRRGHVANQPTSAPPIDSIAILPFENAAQDPNADYLSDGITGSLINRLSQLSNLRVMSGSSVFRYKGGKQDAQEIGSALNVRAVLTGNVKQVGDRFVINVSLDDVKDNHHIWGEQYVRQFSDILAVQNEIAQEVSTTLRIKLTGADERQLAKRYTDNVEAYQLYLKGNYEWNKHTQEDLQKGIDYYHQALEKDPNYALAYFGLAASYGVLGSNYLPPNEGFPKARAYAKKALAIDDALAEAHVAMGSVILFYDWDIAEAEAEFKRAQTLDTNNAIAHQLYGDCLEIRGRFDEVKAERKRALELDPLSPAQNVVAGASFYFAGQYDEAIAQLEKTINLEPRIYSAYVWLGQAYEQKAMYGQAIATYQKGLGQGGRQSQLLAALARAYALAGERNKSVKTLAELRDVSRQGYLNSYTFAVVYIGLGDKDQTLSWLEKAFQDRSSVLLWLGVEPMFASLRDDPRFQDLLRRVGIAG
jgi:DNA-binding winged helix-turn-helix (wHTH) protein/TolB-like protein/Tfp pilus assembly protein PilF